MMPQEPSLEHIQADQDMRQYADNPIIIAGLARWASNPNPEVRRTVAISVSASDAQIRALATDPDPMVATAAQANLRRRGLV